MTEKRADELVKGDVLDLRGDRWTVVKAKVKGKHVRLTIDGRRGSFTDEVKARTVYQVTDAGPLLSPDGAQTRWAQPSETAWDVPASEAEARLVDRLGARLVAVEVEGGRLVVPPVDDATIFGHLLTMHGRRFDGVTVAEAKAAVKRTTPATEASAVEVVDALSLQRAYDIHDDLHKDLTGMARPHWHEVMAPA